MKDSSYRALWPIQSQWMTWVACRDRPRRRWLRMTRTVRGPGGGSCGQFPARRPRETSHWRCFRRRPPYCSGWGRSTRNRHPPRTPARYWSVDWRPPSRRQSRSFAKTPARCRSHPPVRSTRPRCRGTAELRDLQWKKSLKKSDLKTSNSIVHCFHSNVKFISFLHTKLQKLRVACSLFCWTFVWSNLGKISRWTYFNSS